MNYSIAIKLGSSNTSIFKQGEGIVLFEPSLVACSGSGKDRIVKAVGSKAKRIEGRTGEQTFITSPIFEGRIADTDLAVVMLKSFLEKIFPRSLRKPRIKAVVCVPLGLNVTERKAFEKVCFLAGIQDVVLVPSIICGALGYNYPISNPNGVLLVNIGGGSTDVAAVSLNSIVSGVNVGIGGEAMDKAVEKHILALHKIYIGKGVAEKIKTEIGSLYASDTSNTEVNGVDQDTKVSKSVVVESSEIYPVLEHYYHKICEAIQSVLNSCPTNIVEDITNEGIFLFGGASLITGAEQYFRKRLNLKVIVEDQTTAIDVIGAGKLLSDARLLNELSRL